MVTHNIECVSTRCNPNCMLGINLVSRCWSWWGSWGGRAPGSRGGVASKNLSGTAAASAAPPTLLFKLHLNPLDFLLGKINSHLPQTSMRLNWGELETWVPQLVEVSHWWPLRFEVSDLCPPAHTDWARRPSWAAARSCDLARNSGQEGGGVTYKSVMMILEVKHKI